MEVRLGLGAIFIRTGQQASLKQKPTEQRLENKHVYAHVHNVEKELQS